MKKSGYQIFPSSDWQQRLRLQRFLVGTGAHLMNLGMIMLCWSIGFVSTQVVLIYTAVDVVFNLIVFNILRSGLNMRFKDPSLTWGQICVPTLFGFTVMYFAGPARGAFALLALSLFSFGIFRFKKRGFFILAVFILTIYTTAIGSLAYWHADAIDLKVEFVIWLAFAMTLAQFSFVASIVAELRRKVSEKTRELARQNGELEAALQRINDMAIHDELTGVYNRRYLMEKIIEETKRSQRTGHAFSICMIDIDLFKQVNDTYGHLSGDDVLRSIASNASRELRPTDFFGRYGGEEVVMVLSDTLGVGAMMTAERIRKKIEQIAYPGINQTLRVTISIGIAEHIRGSDPQATLKRADEALYRAKESGRNKSFQYPFGA